MRAHLRALLIACFLVLAATACVEAQKRRKAIEFIRPNQVVEIADAPKTFPTSPRGCANDAWAASVRAALKQPGVDLPASDWSTRLAGGDACLQTLPEYEALRRSVEGDHVLGDGRRFRVRAERSPGPPRAADPLIVELQQQRPPIFIYKGRPLLLYGITYDEHIINNLHKQLWITELRCVDPAARPGAEARIVAFRRDDPRVADIEAVIRLRLEPIALGQLDDR